MRGSLLVLMLALTPAALAVSEVDDAYAVVGTYDGFGPVSGYLRVGQHLGGEVWLSGPNVLSLHRVFSFLCEADGVVGAFVVEQCRGDVTTRFVGGYAIDGSGAATGPAVGRAMLPDLQLTVTSHT